MRMTSIGVVMRNGKMVDRPYFKHAAVVARADRIHSH